VFAFGFDACGAVFGSGASALGHHQAAVGAERLRFGWGWQLAGVGVPVREV